MTPTTLPVYFISHGGGPWPWMKAQTGAAYARLEASLQQMPAQVGLRPRAVLMVSAHWEAPSFSVMSNPQPPMLYDYYGFPEHTYRIHYPAPGDPALAERLLGWKAHHGVERMCQDAWRWQDGVARSLHTP